MPHPLPRERWGADPDLAGVLRTLGDSRREPRYHALGRTAEGRLLQATFTVRGGGTLLRVISARDMSRKERRVYEQATQAGA